MAEELSTAIQTQEDSAALELVMFMAASSLCNAQECKRRRVFLENSSSSPLSNTHHVPSLFACILGEEKKGLSLDKIVCTVEPRRQGRASVTPQPVQGQHRDSNPGLGVSKPTRQRVPICALPSHPGVTIRPLLTCPALNL